MPPYKSPANLGVAIAIYGLTTVYISNGLKLIEWSQRTGLPTHRPQNINHYFEVGFDDQAVFDEAGNSRKAKRRPSFKLLVITYLGGKFCSNDYFMVRNSWVRKTFDVKISLRVFFDKIPDAPCMEYLRLIWFIYIWIELLVNA